MGLYIERFHQRCAEHDRKATANRRLVARELYRYGNYIDAVSLYIHIRRTHDVSISTVYIVLNLLVNMGLAKTRMDHEGKMMTYRAVSV